MNTTNQQVFRFRQAANAYLARTKDTPDSKFRYAVRKVRTRAQDLLDQVTEALEDLKIEHCAVETHDPSGVIRKDARGELCFSKSDMNKFNAAVRALYKKSVTIEPHVVPVPADLTEDEAEAFAGFVIAEAPDDLPVSA